MIRQTIGAPKNAVTFNPIVERINIELLLFDKFHAVDSRFFVAAVLISCRFSFMMPRAALRVKINLSRHNTIIIFGQDEIIAVWCRERGFVKQRGRNPILHSYEESLWET
jgi:hypothetical protein